DRREPSGPGTPRLFLAIPIPDETSVVVGGVIEAARRTLGEDGRRIRWVQLEGLHVTLRFLGPTPVDRITGIATALDRAVEGEASFEVRIAGSGTFPSPDRPRALWLGIADGAASIGRLAAAFETAVAEAGWAVEPRAFRPHMTIARTDGVQTGEAAGKALSAAAAGLDVGFRADRVVLYRSHLGSGPARYERLHEALLA
ncbi:MAG: 2'-5' ligase, partial [Chloroflexi bacterium]|nr:2'-5' ligase [Chloroflexota bacterium]